ncbi:MAG: SDR family NAD(P)-dependent oxidoreductase, partial [Oscillospiraceae bacterium]|nr:SDR family NAD(P)-dependent oxidoreductase [Oscillospiraceae bacterium]
FVKMDLNALTAMLQKTYPAEDAARESEALADMMAARLPGEENKRPSVEAILHAIFPYRYVLHVHPALVNGLSCGKDGEALCGSLLGEGAVWVPLTKPGYTLALACYKAFAAQQAQLGSYPQVAVLQNHGLFIAADTVEEIDALTEQVMAALHAQVGAEPTESDPPYDAALACRLAPALRMCYGETATALFTPHAADFGAVEAPFTPDHIVYCRHRPLILTADTDARAAFAAYKAEWGFAPKIVAVQGLGFFALGQRRKEAETARALFLDALRIARYAASFGGANPLPDDFTRFILNWEIESYRQKVAASGGGAGRLQGKIAIVTGSAQGFGKAIAESLADQGAYVLIADLNEAGAQATAAEIGADKAIAVGVNIAEEAAVEAMVQKTVLTFGGLDIFVANAGIVISGGLEEMTKQRFELVTAVNYTGYYLCAKHAARPMRIQHAARPDCWFDIIEINSKSGLAGSNKNFAYAGSKFGGLGLTQSFALELVADGIKVNAVCPGNLLDGPLWADPEKGLFRQYLDAGKVPGAKTVADVRRFYEAKVPMGRGCQTADVARAILYIIEQQYETGQAIPVTGGQVMLN